MFQIVDFVLILSSITAVILIVAAMMLIKIKSSCLEFFAATATLTFFVAILSTLAIKPLYNQGYVAPQKFLKEANIVFENIDYIQDGMSLTEITKKISIPEIWYDRNGKLEGKVRINETDDRLNFEFKDLESKSLCKDLIRSAHINNGNNVDQNFSCDTGYNDIKLSFPLK